MMWTDMQDAPERRRDEVETVIAVLAHPRYCGRWIDAWRIAEVSGIAAPALSKLLMALERTGRAERESKRVGARWRFTSVAGGRSAGRTDRNPV